MERRNIAAFTPPSAFGYPPYISINDTGTMTDAASEGVEITVRSPSKTDGSRGDCAAILLTRKQFVMLMREVWYDAEWPLHA